MKQNFKIKGIKLYTEVLIFCFLLLYPTECSIAYRSNFQETLQEANKQLNIFNKEIVKSMMFRVALTEHIINAQKF